MRAAIATPPSEECLWDVRGAATYLGVSTSYIYKGAERGEIPCIRIGALLRFDPDAVKAWAKKQQHVAQVIPLTRR